MWIQRLLIIVFFAMSGLSLAAQVRPGIKFGASTPHVSPQPFTVIDERGEPYVSVSVEKARYGVYAGVFIQFQFGGFFIQPEALYNAYTIDYAVDTLFTVNGGTHRFRESYKYIDFPLLMGLKAGPLRLGIGAVGHLYLDSGGSFSEYDAYQVNEKKNLTYGWQAGIGLDFWKLHFGVRYEGSLSKLGEEILFFGQPYDFQTNNNKIIGTLGFSF